jgi:REP element-mobilizing transposase RayT
MNFFQNSVLNKHLKAQDSKAIKKAFEDFASYFHNSEIQLNIREAKEEQFQEGFLRELFVTILGYTLNPSPNFNLTTEYKNVKDSKKADGAILINGAVKAVIELKGTETTDLNRIEAQAFGYKNNQPECTYVITSNFEKLRFYIDNAIEHIEFNLFTLTEKEFELLWLCLAFVNIEKNLPKRIKDESVSQEDVITKNLYNDYSLFKRELHQNLVALNPDHDPLTLFKKSQKLLDRFLFLFFAEDRQLLPPNSVRLILDDWRDLQDRDVQIPLYDRFKKYFEYLNTGFKGKRYDVFAYNGGLFKTDELLDSLKIDDDLLYRHAMKLSTYDFVSEVDVNILGHIFENSLNELEEIKAQLEGQHVDKAKSKRKKDGVFYTPKYITKYIVDNTVGKLCIEKKSELELVEEEYTTDRKRTIKTKQPLFDKLATYRNWLLQLTICDPACGSGAFLNQALDFLINEHRYIDELQAKLLGSSIVLSDFENSILENNLFGVDINEESVEIAKLSLWLRTAQPNRKLNDLNNNIKCGNSLIDDPAVAGDKAFNWQEEFPTVFPEKAKRAWHVTTATHNSRYSQRMIDYHVQVGDPVWLSEKEEIIVTETIAKIVIEDKLNVMAYNICGDHMHIVLVCEEVELQSIMQKIKSMSARACNIAMGRTIPQAVEHAPQALEHAPQAVEHALRLKDERGKTQFHLWTQKFGSKEIVTEEQLNNTIAYVQNNRVKHQLTSQHIDNSDGACSIAVDNADADYNGESSITQAANPANAANANGDGACSIAIDSAIENIAATFTSSISHALRTEYKGGFDVVIGNPPYVTRGISDELKKALNLKFVTAQYQVDLYVAFIEKGISLLNNISEISFIVPNSWLKNLMMSECRKFILDNLCIEEIIPSLGNVFPDASVDTMIFVGSKHRKIEKINIYEFSDSTIKFKHQIIKERILLNDGFVFDVEVSEKILPIMAKMKIDTYNIESLFDINRGINPYDIYTGQAKEIIEQRAYHSNYKKDSTFVPELKGMHVSRYLYNWDNLHFISYGDWLAAPRDIKYFEGERIIFREILGKNLVSTLITEDFKIDRSLYIAKLLNDKRDFFNVKFILSILNSTLLAYYFRFSNNEFDNLFPKIRVAEFKKLPIKNIRLSEQKPFIQIVELMLTLSMQLQTLSQKFQRTIQRKFNLSDLPGKLQNWYLLTYPEFITELAKKKVKLSLTEEAEWEAYFLQEAKQALALKAEIDKTDKEIDRMVYELYGLTEEEIKIVECN